MLDFLNNHPFAVEAFFKTSIVITFSVPKVQLQNLIPECLELDTYNDEYGFIAVAMVQTTELRPNGFPRIFGRDFFLIGYRIFVRYTNSKGKRSRGLYILKSETNRTQMAFLGNIFTKYNYTTTDIIQETKDDIIKIESTRSNFFLSIEKTQEEIALPKKSPFVDWKEARRFAGPLPFTFTYNAKERKVLIVEGVRENWMPKPIKVLNYYFDFINSMDLQNVNLANAFIIENVPYRWKKGRIEQWKS